MRKVATTSVLNYHKPETQAMIATQTQRVSAYVVKQTKAGQPVCIGSIWEYFSQYERAGLGQKGTVSRVCNDLEKLETIVVDGLEYRFERVAARKHNGRMCQHFCLVLNMGN